DRPPRTPAECLEPQRAGAGEQVDDDAIDDQLAEDVEHRLAHQVAGRPGAGRGARAVDLVPAALPRDDAHGSDAPLRRVEEPRAASPAGSDAQAVRPSFILSGNAGTGDSLLSDGDAASMGRSTATGTGI